MNPINVQSWISQHRVAVAKAAAVISACLVSYASGRYLTPPQVQVQEKVVEHVKTEVQRVEVSQEHEQQEKAVTEHEHVHRVDRIITHVDGTREEVKTEDRNAGTVVQERQVQFVDRDVYHETVKYQDRDVVREKTTTITAPPPSWLVTPMIGIRSPTLKPLAVGGLVYGGAASRRVVGPVFAGAWALSNGSLAGTAAGISVTVQF